METLGKLTNQYFTIDGIKFYLPMKMINGKPLGAMANLTAEDFKTLQEENSVKLSSNGKIFTTTCEYEDSDLFELNISAIPYNVVCIDIDGDDDVDFKSISDAEKVLWVHDNVPELIKSLPYTLSRTKKLPHYFFILEGVDKNVLSNCVKITTNCLSFCKGDVICANVWEKPNSKLFNYTGELPIIHIDELKPYLLDNVLHKMFNSNVKRTQNIKSSTTLRQMNNEEFKNGSEDDLKYIKTCIKLGKLDFKNSSYNDWRDVGFAIYNTDNTEKGVELFDLFSQRCPDKYDEMSVRNQWNKFNNNHPNPLTIGSIKMWVKPKTNNIKLEIKEQEPEPEEKEKEDDDDDILNDELIGKPYTTGLVADYFVKLHKNKFIFCNDILYFYNGFYWEEDDKRFSYLTSFVDKTFYLNLIDYVNNKLSLTRLKMEKVDDYMAELYKKFIEETQKLLKNVNSIRSVNNRKSLIQDIITFLTNNKIKFNENPYLFAFNNAIFDLKNDCFIDPKPEYYISMTCGYDYDFKYDYNNVNILNGILDTIFPDPEIKNYYLSILSTGLCGIQMENCFIANGGGGNGKSLLNAFVISALGNYAYVLPAGLLLTEIKEGANPQIANLNNKRFAIAQEPNAKRNICCATLKEITGNTQLNSRGLYSSVCVVNLMLTLIMECNTLPNLDEVNEAVNRRMRVIPFVSSFLTQDKYDELDEEEKTKYFVANPYYKTDEFKIKIRQALFTILKSCFKNIYSNDKITLPNQPDICKKKSIDYLSTSDDIFSWFNEYYEKCNVSEPIYFSDIYTTFTTSTFYYNLSKTDKRKYNKKYFNDKIENNLFLRKSVKLRKEYYNKTQLSKDAIVGWKLKSTEENKDAEEC